MRKKLVCFMMAFVMMSFGMVGCGKSETPTEIEENEIEADEEQVTESENIEETKQEQIASESDQEDMAVEEADVAEQSTSQESTEPQTEVTESETEVEVTAPGEVTYITDYTSVIDYMGSLDAETPAIIIYNEEESYIINMQEGQHYQLKSADQILFNFEEPYGFGWDFSLGGTTLGIINYSVFDVDYSKMEKNQEFYLKRRLDDGEIIQLTCYLDPPEED